MPRAPLMGAALAMVVTKGGVAALTVGFLPVAPGPDAESPCCNWASPPWPAPCFICWGTAACPGKPPKPWPWPPPWSWRDGGGSVGENYPDTMSLWVICWRRLAPASSAFPLTGPKAIW